MTFDALDDNIDDVFGGVFVDREMLPAEQRKAPIPVEVFTEPCRKCDGTGNFLGYTRRMIGTCFTCKGKGTLTFKTSAATRAANRAGVERRKEAAADKAVADFAAAHAATYGWMIAASNRGFNFATDMLANLKKWGSLTERQIAAMERCAAQDAERAAEKAKRETGAKAVDITRIVGSMTQAMAKGVKRPILRLDAFRFSLSTKGDGVIYVRDADNSDRYLGKITEAHFTRSRDCTVEEESRILAAASDPTAAAKAYGRRTGACSACGRELTNAESIEMSIGPICASRYSL